MSGIDLDAVLERIGERDADWLDVTIDGTFDELTVCEIGELFDRWRERSGLHTPRLCGLPWDISTKLAAFASNRAYDQTWVDVAAGTGCMALALGVLAGGHELVADRLTLLDVDEIALTTALGLLARVFGLSPSQASRLSDRARVADPDEVIDAHHAVASPRASRPGLVEGLWSRHDSVLSLTTYLPEPVPGRTGHIVTFDDSPSSPIEHHRIALTASQRGSGPWTRRNLVLHPQSRMVELDAMVERLH